MKKRQVKLYTLLDRVNPRHEVTIDAEECTRDQVGMILMTAKERGLNASYDGRFVLIRDIRNSL